MMTNILFKQDMKTKQQDMSLNFRVKTWNQKPGTRNLKLGTAVRLMLLTLLMLVGGIANMANAASYQYTYYVVNLSGEIATQARATQEEGSAPVIPDVIKSSLLADGTAGTYSYYTLDQFDVASNIYTLHESHTALAALPSAATDIYVKYTYDNSKSAIDLSGETIYYIKDTNPSNSSELHYLTYDKAYGSADWRTDGSTNSNDNFGDNDKERQWVYEGNDPYKIYIRNVYRRDANADSYLRSNLAKGKFEDNGDLRYGGQTTTYLFNTYFFNTNGYVVASNNVYKWENSTNKYIYLYKNGKTNYGDTGGRFYVTGSGNMDLNTMRLTTSATADVTFHLVNNATNNVTYSFDTTVDTDDPKPSAVVMARLTRLGATLVTTYYKEKELTNAITTPLEVTDIYIPYTVDAATLSSTYNITFSTEEDPVWFSMKINAGGGKLFFYDRDRNVIDSRSNETAAKPATDTRAQYAFIGDPYSFKIICKDLDGQYAFQDSTEVSGFSNKIGNVRFSSSPEDTYSSFAIIGGTASGTFQIFRRDLPFTTYRAFFDADGNGNQIWLYRYTSGNEVQAGHNITATPTPKYNYTYNIVDNNGRIAIKYTVSQYASTRLDGEHGHEALPEAIYSPYLKGETLTFYSTLSEEGSRNNLSNSITATPAAAANIYVSYTTELLNTRLLPLDGKSYSVKVGGESGKYVKYDSGLSLSATLPNPRTDEANFSKHVWFTSNEDPYNVSIRNNTPFALLDNSTNTQFILMKGSSNDEAQVELLLASGLDISSEYSKSLALNAEGDALELATTSRGNDRQQVILTDATISVYYRIIDKQKKIVIQVEDKTAESLNVPAAWRSPLCTYHYWKRSDFIESGGIYTLKDGVSEITALSQATDGYIYVTYDVKTSSDDGFIDLDGRNSSTNYMYRLEFASGDSFYQENSKDGFLKTKTEAKFPYSNGDAGFYIYGSAQWEEQQYAASTRTRWAWILEGNDPYHTKISSFQTQTTESGVARHAYFRTYIVNYGGSDHIVTGSVTDNSLPVAAGDLPSEYMILGTSLTACKLVTTETVGTGTDGYASTAHRVVNSFEQYWKNNPTAQNVLGNSKLTEGGDDVELTDAQRTLLKTADDSNHKGEWHSYEAWATSAPWVRRADGTTGKVHGKHEHWFQTINMGDGTMQFQRVDLNGVLILLDNHGWEVARKPMGRLDNKTAKAELDKEIRKYDSPMVKEYKFWTNFDKLSGYHKYKPHVNDKSASKNADVKGTGTSLADYPEVKSNGMLQDLYVTYTVKPQYVNAYTGAATEDATTVNTSFLIRQGGVLAKTTDGTSIQPDATYISGIDAGSVTLNNTDNPEFFWCLRPNFNIDAEMGYQYSGAYSEKTKEQTELDYVNDSVSVWHNGFDPYNVQIYNYKYTTKYFVTNANNAGMVERQHLASTDPAGDHTLSLGSNTTEKFSTTVSDYDGTTIHPTNATFLVVQDANGNMRLMPRFDHSRHINGFTALTTPAAAQPEDDKTNAQSTWLLRPPSQTYIVVDNQGREALRYTSLNDGAPVIPAKFRSPLAENFTFYKTLTETGTDTHVYNLTTLADTISTFAESGLSEGGTVYVRYQYNPDADIDQLLYGTWYHAKLNDADVEVTSGGVIKKSLGETPTDGEKTAHRWRFKESAGDEPDPYAVTLWNGTPASESGKRYIIMHHFNGTDYSDYALMQAGTITTASYSFLDGSSTPTITAKSGYSTDGVIAASMKLKLTKVAATSSVIFKIITHSRKVALTSETVAVDASTNLATVMPDWLKTPIMEDDAYIFYSAATETDGTYDIKGVPTTSPTTLDGNVVYVRYDYEKSKKAITSFGTEKEEAYKDKFDGLPYNYAPLDLSGKVAYTMGTISTSEFQGKLWSVNDDATIKQDKLTVNQELTREARLWYFTGNDPYEVTIQNPAHSTTKVLAGTTPNLEADWANAPNDKYPLVKMVEPDDKTYTLNTFMVLKYNPNEKTGKEGNVSHCAGTLKFYITGNDRQYLAESNKLAGGIYVYTDDLTYKNRLLQDSEPLNPKDGNMIIYSSFFYRPVLTYHVITNDKKEALKGYSLMADTKVSLPEVYQSPLLNSSDFTYYSAADIDGRNYTVKNAVTTSTTITSLVTQSIGDIYVRYTYDRDKSPFKIATNINDAAEDGTRLSWIDERGLDLSGNTWYTIANMLQDFSSAHGTVLGAREENTTSFQKINVSALTNGRAPSDKEFLWRLWGNDPYAIKITNGYYGDDKYMSITTNSNRQEMSEANKNYYQTFMLLNAHAIDNGNGRFDTDSDGETNYLLKRWTVLVATGTNQFTRCTTNSINNATGEFYPREWSLNDKTFSTYDIRMSSDTVVSRKIFNMGSGSTTPYCIEFVKAPVTRKYHYHAIKYDESGNKVGETWDAIMEHDWLQPVVLEAIFARRYCKYEKRNTEATGDNVTGTGNFQTQAYLEAEGQPNAQFYHDAALTERVKDTKSGYDIYPEIDLDDVYDIYFKYQVDNEATLNLAGSDKKLSDITSTTAQIEDDATHYNLPLESGGGRMGPDYTRQAKWFYMVLDTDEDITTTVDGTTRTPIGRQLFLRREDDGTVNWMNNIYTLHKESVDNYKGWSYDRLAESYRKGDNDAFREGRWLWAFIGDDPYNMRIINFESAVGVKAESSGVYSLAAADNCFVTINKGTTTSGDDTYPVTIPTEEPTENQYWGLCVGVNNSTEQTFSLLSTAITETIDEQQVNQPLYWHMVSHTANKVTTESVEGMLDYVPDRSYAIQLLPYEPLRYEDVKVVIRRDDEVTTYNTWKEYHTDETDRLNYVNNTMTTGLSKLYFAASERKYVAGDEINTSKEDALPLQVRRAFCNYTMYSDIFETDNTIYTVQAGPYPDYSKPKTGQYDEDGHQIYAYYNVDSNGVFTGEEVTSGAQAIYVKYVVTSDIFLKTPPSKTEVEAMAQNNDHVYFMDFPDQSSKATYHHAYYDPMSTMRSKTGDLKTQRDSKTGVARPEKRKWDSSTSAFVDDTDNWYNHYQYRTANNRMESVPENLKWYFVGDPYKVQVFCAAGEWNTAKLKDENGADIDGTEAGKIAAQLARFNTVESNFQFAIDCVHLRVKDPSIIDNRQTLYPYNENGVEDTSAEGYHNRHYNQPYFDDFYWECVPTTSDEAGTFALRFKEDNQLLGYRNVYYYLAHDGLSKTYQQKNYSINLSYNADNEKHETGTYAGYHTANDVNTVIKLVQPVKVYVTANRQGDGDRYTKQENVVKDELSEYYGLNETITEVPRHLQRKFVNYSDLTDEDGSTMSEHKLSITNATSYGTCGTSPYDNAHTQTINDLMTNKVSKEYVNPVFKFSVYYTVDDLSKDEAGNDAHLFSPTTSTLNWVDMAVLGNGTNWLFFDKTQADKTQVSNYRTAIGDNSADGWNDGLKGLHWALVGDPYDFTILNRRRYEDGKNAEPQWLTVTKLPANTLKDIHDKDSTVWTTAMVTEAEKATYNAITSTDIAAAAKATHFSTQMWKLSPKNSNGTYQTGNADAYYFLRTSSLKTGDDDTNNNSGTNQTNNYWRMVAKAYPNASSPTSYFEMVPYSLSEKNTYINTQYMENYSQTMTGLGVTQQRLEIRTAVAKDEDDADNNCFDADVEIRTLNGVLRLKKSDMEIRYGDVEAALPASLRRYGCSYKCYLNYDAATNSGTEITNFGEFENEEGYAELTRAMTAARTAHDADATKSPRPLLTYVYTVDDATSQFFTTVQDARTEDYTWANSYFYWEQTYSGSSVEVEKTKLVFDHYVYNSDGKIIDEVWREVSYTEVVNNPTTPYPTKGYLNTHTSQTPVYADETVQSKENRQKWAMTGDPYGFTMKNYAQYLSAPDAIVSMSGTDVITQNYGDGQTFAYVVNKDGTPYLAIINNDSKSDTYGNIIKLVDFEFSSTSNKTLESVGNGVNPADATGNSLATTYVNSNGKTVSVKPFYLTNLMSYADLVKYHLVMAHQYSLDYSDDGLTYDIKTKLAADVNKRMLEFLMYWGIKEHSTTTTSGKGYYIKTFDTNGTPTTYDTEKENDIKALLKEKGTLRNFYSYPVDDQEVDRIGVGNRPQLPWYMKRQFCTYYMYQRDVQRSVADNAHPSFQQADADWIAAGKQTCTIVLGRTYTDHVGTTYTADQAFVDYYAGKIFKSNDGTNPIPMTFEENGETKQAFNVKWVSIFDKSHWTEVSATDLAAKTETSARTAAGWEDVSGTWRKKPSGYDEALDLQGVILDKLYDCHQNRKVIIDVIYEVKPETFRFAQAGRNTTAWYQMMTNNYLADGLLNFSYKDGIGGRLDRTHHYTNNYLWAPEGDPYGFVLRSRYATINGTGWDDVAVTTEGKLPKGEDAYGNPIYKDGTGAISPYTEPTDAEHDDVKASYTGNSSSSRIPFNHKRIIHRRQGDEDGAVLTDGATNAVYEMFVGGYDGSFLMHPTAAWMDNSDVDYQSYYMVHETTSHEGYVAHRAYLEKFKADDLRYVADANWRLECSNEQLLPYFQRAGYVGGLRPAEAEKFTNQEYYNRLKNGDTFTFTELTALQNLVYGGKFYKSDGKTEVKSTDPRPTGTDLPMKFVSNNLVTMTPGYYRIKAFSEDALNVDGADLGGNGSGIKGVTGPRYVSGYRFNSAKTDTNDPKNYGGRWLHFFETDMAHSDIHTYADLKAKITAAQVAGQTDRDMFDHPAMSGNIEILPADFDPSSIFQFIEDSGTESYTRYKIKTQGLTLWARPGSSEDDATEGNHDFGRTELVESTPSAAEGYTDEYHPGGWNNKFRLEDIGGAATTIRVREVQDDNWDVMVAENLKTNYVCIDGKHRYRITCHKNNEMVEIGDHYTTDGINGVQDTKWLLQPVGMREEWPYNQMPLRVEVQQGGVRNQDLYTSAGYLAMNDAKKDEAHEANKDQYYYGSLYVPFDTRLANTTDAAFTLTNDATANTGQVTMQSLSQLNGMGNPQYVPAAWPVILRTNRPNSVKLMNQPVGEALAKEYATRHYVNMYLPYSEPQTGLEDEKATIKLRGEYLERTLDDTYMRTKEGNDEYTLTGKSIMVFGIPFVNHTVGSADEDVAHHEYDAYKRVGWYTNDNWERENYSGYKAHAASYAAAGTTGTVATDAQRSNLYVYHNKVYYPYTLKPATAREHIVALFDEEPDGDDGGISGGDVPWPCDVYDLAGRRVAENETPQTLRKNHPALPKGVYIFAGRKVVVK